MYINNYCIGDFMVLNLEDIAKKYAVNPKIVQSLYINEYKWIKETFPELGAIYWDIQATKKVQRLCREQYNKGV